MASTYKKVPVILQMEALECGAASLGMILAYYGRFIPLEQLRVDCGVSRDGSKATNILAAARFHGMKAKGYRYSAEKVKELPTFPVIIHWNFNHFVVLDGFKKNRAVINDPASGIVEVSMEEFERSYTGITLVVEPGETFEPSGKKKSTWDFLGKYAKKNRAGIIGIILCGFLIAMLNIAIPVFSKIFMDYILLASASEWMGYLTKAMLVETIALFVLRMILAVLMLRAQKTVSMQMNVKFMWHSLRLPVEFYGQRSSGDISGRQMDNDVITKLFFGRIAPAVIDVLMAIIYFVVLIVLHPKMALISFVAVLRQFVSVKVMAGKNQIASKSVSRDEGKYTGAAMAGISMIETIKASGAEEGYFRKIVGYLTKYNNSQTKLNSHMLVTTFLPDLMAKLCNAVVLIVGVYYILNGEITIGFLLAFQGFVAQFLDPIGAVLMIGSEIQQVISKLERVEDVLNYEPDVKEDFLETPEETVEYTRLSGAMECRDLCFGYGRLSPLFIENFNMTVRPGEIVALVGGSGSGKSTLANLITGIYPPRSGEILFDGKQRSEIDRYVFTQSVGIINQTISLFRDTIRNNLTLWDNKVEDQVVLDACKVAGIFDDIMTRPERLDFMLTEGGKNMSGGQRQRLEIARALIKRPSLLILDEATSALDPPTEKHVMDAIRDRKITCIIIAHRLSTIRNADQIIMLERGKVVEVGNHESLIEADGAYARLVKSE